MGKQLVGGLDLAVLYVSGQFTGTGRSGNASTGVQSGDASTKPASFRNAFNVALWGTFVATVRLEKSYDGGTTWIPVAKDVDGNYMTYTAPVDLGMFEPEHGVLYSWNCTAYTSGTINYRISQ